MGIFDNVFDHLQRSFVQPTLYYTIDCFIAENVFVMPCLYL